MVMPRPHCQEFLNETLRKDLRWVAQGEHCSGLSTCRRLQEERKQAIEEKTEHERLRLLIETLVVRCFDVLPSESRILLVSTRSGLRSTSAATSTARQLCLTCCVYLKHDEQP